MASFLSRPVVILARSTHPIQAEDSIALGARRLRESGAGILPIVREGVFLGAVTERSIAEILANGVELTDPVTKALDKADLRVGPHMTGAEALRLFEDLQVPALVVTDEGGRVAGVLTPSDLYPRSVPPPRPPLIGGMATPFGVYLTTGVVRAGASDLALVTTGMLLSCMLFGAAALAQAVAVWMGNRSYNPSAIDNVRALVTIVVFGLQMRFNPIAKIHAAEHMVVHAIEREEELTPEIVERMPRVHPRCGTNFGAGAAIFLAIGTTTLIENDTARLLIALAATLLLWKQIGSVVQRFVTTAPPKQKQIEMGIRSGKELLQKYVESPVLMPSFFKRIYFSGMLHVLAGNLIIGSVAWLIARWLRIDLV